MKPEDFGRVEYPEVRRGLLSRWDTGCDDVEWLVDAGAYLRACWLAEAQMLGDDPLDEDKTKPLWDEFTEGDLADQSVKAQLALKDYVKRKRFDDIVDHMRKALARAGLDASIRLVATAIRSLAWLFQAIVWCILAMIRGVLSLFGVLIFGWILLSMDPSVKDRVSAMAAELLAKTQ